MLIESFVKKESLFMLFLTLILLSQSLQAKKPPDFFSWNMTGKNLIDKSSDRFIFGISYFNVMRNSQNAIEGRIEYRSSFNFLNIHPFAGLTFTSSGAFYGMAGLYHDFFLDDKLVLTPGFAGGYFNKGMGIDLAFELEFRSQIEISYIMQNNNRMGVSFHHMSNGNFGKSNPGVENISFFYYAAVE
jgi:hypothetical protein